MLLVLLSQVFSISSLSNAHYAYLPSLLTEPAASVPMVSTHRCLVEQLVSHVWEPPAWPVQPQHLTNVQHVKLEWIEYWLMGTVSVRVHISIATECASPVRLSARGVMYLTSVHLAKQSIKATSSQPISSRFPSTETVSAKVVSTWHIREPYHTVLHVLPLVENVSFSTMLPSVHRARLESSP